MRIYFLAILVVACSAAGKAQTRNYKVADDELQPSIDVNLKNPENIVIAAGSDKIHYSLDGGRTWNEGKVKSASAETADLQVFSNTHGETYLLFNGIAEADGKKLSTMLVKESKTGGKTWSAETLINSSPKVRTPPRITMHPKKNKISLTWIQSDQAMSADPACHSDVMYCGSLSGDRWTVPEKINLASGDCSGSDNALHDPSVVMDDEHKVFAAWELGGNIVMDRSYDAAATWLNNDMTGFKLSGTRQYSVPGIEKSERAPFLMADNSRSLFQNSIYMVWADQRNGSDDTDIWLATSIRRGDSWTPAVKVNGDAKGKHQFMPSAAIDQSTGIIYLVYYDRREYTDDQTDVYLAWSVDGGGKFTEKKISETPFTPAADKSFTKKISISASEGVIAATWVRMDEGKTTLWTTVLKQSDIIKKEQMPKLKAVQRKPTSSSYQPRTVQQKLKPRN